jgi:hypothetical protein
VADDIDGDGSVVGHPNAIPIDVEDLAAVYPLRVEGFCVLHARSLDTRAGGDCREVR